MKIPWDDHPKKKKEDNSLLVLKMVAILSLVFVVAMVVISEKNRPDDSLNPVLIRTNSIGCSKYTFKGDEYWKCPKQLGANYIEEDYPCGKNRCKKEIPVVSN